MQREKDKEIATLKAASLALKEEGREEIAELKARLAAFEAAPPA